MDDIKQEMTDQKPDASLSRDMVSILEQGTQVQIQCSMMTNSLIKQHPQRTSDPLDPLNWTSLRKHTILGIVMLKYGSIHCMNSENDQRPLLTINYPDTFCSRILRLQQFHHLQKFKASLE